MNGQYTIKSIAVVSAAVLLSACVGAGGEVSRSPLSLLRNGAPNAAGDAAPVMSSQMEDGTQSEIIEGLLNRRSVLPTGPYTQVADAVLAANSRSAEADLRAAKLRAEARASNWLPTMGPSISLTSLGDVISGMVIEQVLFDNGRKKGERDYAAADVEVAAVTLAQDSNERVRTALDLYLTAQAATARAAVNAAAMEKMDRYAYIMSERVRGGVSTQVDLQIIQQKQNQMRSDLASDQEAASSAMSELLAMSSGSLDGVSGLAELSEAAPNVEPLTVMKAQAEAKRAMAEARVARAGFLPGLTASGTVSGGGSSGALNIGAPNGFGFGTGASLRAAEAQQAAATARVGQVREDANRSLRALEGQRASLQRQAAQAQTLAAQAASNYDIFAQQQREGQRTVNDVVGIFETKVRTERGAVDLRYDLARLELKIAAIMGTLVEGEKI